MLNTHLFKYTSECTISGSNFHNFLCLRRQGGIDPLTKILRTFLTVAAATTTTTTTTVLLSRRTGDSISLERPRRSINRRCLVTFSVPLHQARTRHYAATMCFSPSLHFSVYPPACMSVRLSVCSMLMGNESLPKITTNNTINLLCYFFVIFGRLSLHVAILSLPAIRDKRKAFYCRSGE